jgi:transposase
MTGIHRLDYPLNFAALLAEKEAVIAAQAVQITAQLSQIAALLSAQAVQANQLKMQALLIEKLTYELAYIKRVMFGRSSEASELLAVQSDLSGVETTALAGLAETAVPANTALAPPAHKAPKGQPKRMLFSSDLPRETVILDLPDAEKIGLVYIGTESSQRLHYAPGVFTVIVTERRKYAKPGAPEFGIRAAPLPLCVLPGGMLDETVIAYVAVAKFADHQPLTRQIDVFKRSRIEFSLSTLSENLLNVALIWLAPLVNALWQLLKTGNAIHVDETVLATLPQKGDVKRETKKTRLWTYLGRANDPSNNNLGAPIILYHYTQNKAGLHVREALKNWPQNRTVYLQADAASNYDALFKEQPDIREVACWAHARRKFYAIAEQSKVRIFAHLAVEQIDQLFVIERQIKDGKLSDPLAYRCKHATPILAAIKASLEAKLPGLAPKTPTAGAIKYVLNHWAAFNTYLEAAHLKPDNNAAERALRKAALGRKNYLFVGNERGGAAAAIYYSLIETAKANGIEPFAWLTHALKELPKRKSSNFEDIKDLLPIKRPEHSD